LAAYGSHHQLLHIEKHKEFPIITDKQTCYIPKGITLKPELFTGFGGRELKEAVLMAAVLLPIVLLLFLITQKTALTIVTAMTAVAASVLFTTKDTNNISVVHQVGYLITYLLSQREYPYPYHSIYYKEDLL
jgi:hypothetical protein